MKAHLQTGAAMRNLVISDLFFGLGAILLIVIAVISLSVKGMLDDLIATSEPSAKDTEIAVQRLAHDIAPVLYATESGLRYISVDGSQSIGLNDISAAPQLSAWLPEASLLVIDVRGQETAFLTFAAAARAGIPALNTLRLTSDCRSLRQTGDGQIACGR